MVGEGRAQEMGKAQEGWVKETLRVKEMGMVMGWGMGLGMGTMAG